MLDWLQVPAETGARPPLSGFGLLLHRQKVVGRGEDAKKPCDTAVLLIKITMNKKGGTLGLEGKTGNNARPKTYPRRDLDFKKKTLRQMAQPRPAV